MGSLRYTNILLTIIAVTLVYHCLRDTAIPSVAATKPTVQSVKVVSMPAVVLSGVPAVRPVGEMDVNIAGVYGMVWTKETADSVKGTLPVTIRNPILAVDDLGGIDFPSEIDVNVTNDSLPVAIEKVSLTGSGFLSPPDALPVRIEGANSINPISVSVERVSALAQPIWVTAR